MITRSSVCRSDTLQRHPFSSAVIDFPEDCESLIVTLVRLIQFSGLAIGIAEIEQANRCPGPVSRRAPQMNRLPECINRLLVVTEVAVNCRNVVPGQAFSIIVPQGAPDPYRLLIAF